MHKLHRLPLPNHPYLQRPCSPLHVPIPANPPHLMILAFHRFSLPQRTGVPSCRPALLNSAHHRCSINACWFLLTHRGSASSQVPLCIREQTRTGMYQNLGCPTQHRHSNSRRWSAHCVHLTHSTFADCLLHVWHWGHRCDTP